MEGKAEGGMYCTGIRGWGICVTQKEKKKKKKVHPGTGFGKMYIIRVRESPEEMNHED